MDKPVKFEHQTPFFIFDEKEFLSGVNGFREALRRNFAQPIVSYSVKTNSLPFLLEICCREGVYAEVVSYDEYNLARLCGFSVDRIVYNGPMKNKETFIEAMENGAMVNIETKRELEWLECLDKSRKYKVGIRINLNLSEVGYNAESGDIPDSRFGFSIANGEFQSAAERISAMGNVSLKGIHLHRTTHDRAPEFYSKSVCYAIGEIKRSGIELDWIDMGGGYFGIFRNKPTFDDYSEAIRLGLGDYDVSDVKIIVEPGNALAAACFTFVTEVIDEKNVTPDFKILTTDGSRNDIDPFFRKTSYLEEIEYNGEPERRRVGRQMVAGCTCLENDRLFELRDSGELKRGDRIIYHNVGAYTFGLSPQFIRFWPPVYCLTAENECRLVRHRSSADDFFNLSK